MSRVRTNGLAWRIMPARRGFLAILVAAVATVALMQTTGGAAAQPVKQIPLTEKQVTGFIAAQKDMAAVAQKMQGNTSNKPDPKIQAELEAVAKKYGFASFADTLNRSELPPSVGSTAPNRPIWSTARCGI